MKNLFVTRVVDCQQNVSFSNGLNLPALLRTTIARIKCHAILIPIPIK